MLAPAPEPARPSSPTSCRARKGSRVRVPLRAPAPRAEAVGQRPLRPVDPLAVESEEQRVREAVRCIVSLGRRVSLDRGSSMSRTATQGPGPRTPSHVGMTVALKLTWIFDDANVFNNKLRCGRTTTTTTAPTAASTARPLTNDYDRRPRPQSRKRPTSVAHTVVKARYPCDGVAPVVV